VAALLDEMRKRALVPEGWDVALHLSQAAVQSLVHHAWDGTGATRALSWVAPAEVDGHHDVVDLQTELQPPKVGLDPAGQAATLAFAIDTGTLKLGKAPAELVARAPDATTVAQDGGVVWSDTSTITRTNPLALDGKAPLGATAASAGGFTIGLDLSRAAISLTGPDAGGVTSQSVEPALRSWLTAEHLTGRIATLTPSTGPALHALTVARLATRVVTSAGGKPVLQILMAAQGAATAPAGTVSLALADQHDFNLMVSSKAAMAMIAAGYNQGTGEIKLDTLPPQDGQPHWVVQVREPMVFEGSFGIEGGETYATDHAQFHMRFGGSTDKGLTLFTHTDPSSTARLEMDLASQHPLAIQGSGTAQMVGLTAGTQSVTGEGFYEDLVKPQLDYFLSGDIRSDMAQVRLTALSTLAFHDLALSGHRLAFETAALPGELTIAGSLAKTG